MTGDRTIARAREEEVERMIGRGIKRWGSGVAWPSVTDWNPDRGRGVSDRDSISDSDRDGDRDRVRAAWQGEIDR